MQVNNNDDRASIVELVRSWRTIKTGDKVGWINTDQEVHTVTSGFENSTDKGKQFDSGLLNTNQTFEHTFDKAGTYNYFCTVHPTMAGVVNVK